MPQINRCWQCGALATRLCDYRIAWTIVGSTKQRTPYTSSTAEHPTCGRALCAACATPPPGLFLCGEGMEPLDYCGPHVTAWIREAPVPLLDRDGIARLRARLAAACPPHQLRLLHGGRRG